MLLPFSDTTNRTGIIQLIEDNTLTQGATSSSYPLTVKTRDVNMALVEFMMIAMEVSGKWKVDDTNQTDYPFVTFNLAANQQDYSFLNDGSTIPNQILDIHHVEIKDANGNWITLDTYDMFNDGTRSLNQSATQAGTPTRYAKTANGIFFDLKPDYSSTNGAKIYFSRSPSYFASTDTTKYPGIPDMFHRWCALRPSYDYCLRKGMANAGAYKLELYGPDGKSGLKGSIEEYYSSRDKDAVMKISMKRINSR